MNKKIKLNSIDKQLRALSGLELLGFLKPASVIWLLLLSSRGFSAWEQAAALAFCGISGLLAYIPAEAFTERFGARASLLLGHFLLGLGAAVMLFLSSFALAAVLLGLLLTACGFVLIAGRTAIQTAATIRAADSETDPGLFMVLGKIMRYIGLCVAFFFASIMVTMGFQSAYAVDVFLSFLCILLSFSIRTPESDDDENAEKPAQGRFSEAVNSLFKAAISILRKNAVLMLAAGAIAAVTAVFAMRFQTGFVEAGASVTLAGPLLALVVLGHAAGSLLVKLLMRLKQTTAVIICFCCAALGVVAALTSSLPLLAIRGFLAAAAGAACAKAAINKAGAGKTTRAAFAIVFCAFIVVFAIASGFIA